MREVVGGVYSNNWGRVILTVSPVSSAATKAHRHGCHLHTIGSNCLDKNQRARWKAPVGRARTVLLHKPLVKRY